MEKKDANYILNRYNAGDATNAERAMVETWYLRYKEPAMEIEPDQLMADQKESLKDLMGMIKPAKPERSVGLWPKIAAAAVVLVTIATGLLLYSGYFKHNVGTNDLAYSKHDIAPGGNRAILTLADGSKVSLTDASNGKLAQQAGIAITKTKDGQLVYTVGKQATSDNAQNASPSLLNTIETPRGGQYQINLPDGTKVWLNASSSIKYPLVFANGVRRVELSGEAYFEVAHNASMPFLVISNDQLIEVLGTHFNVNAYKDEAEIKTTLLKGSVRVSKGRLKTILSPGQQSVVGNDIEVNSVDAEAMVDWKNGDFIFNNEELQSIMRKVARWYNVEIVYQGKPVELRCDGWVSRTKNVSAVLKMIESTGKVHFKVEGRRITVMP